jgi:FixJ family two-component response regulator
MNLKLIENDHDIKKILPLRVLHVEDNPADVGLVSAVLEEATDAIFKNENVTTLAAAKKRLLDRQKVSFDVILLDLGLPDSQGLQTLYDMLQVSEELPVVVLTGLDDIKLGREAVAAGAEDYLEKKQTVQGTLLARTLEYAVERYRRRQLETDALSEIPDQQLDSTSAQQVYETRYTSYSGRISLHQREPSLFEALQEQYLKLLKSSYEGVDNDAALIPAASNIIDQLAAMMSEPADLIELHSRAYFKLQQTDIDDGGRLINCARQLMLTMMSRLSNHYLNSV